MTITGNYDAHRFGVFNSAANAPLTLAGAVGGTGSLTETGSGLLILAANNTYGGTDCHQRRYAADRQRRRHGIIRRRWIESGDQWHARLQPQQQCRGFAVPQRQRQRGQLRPRRCHALGQNTFQGGTAVTGGTLTAANNAAFGSGPLSVGSSGTANFPTASPSIGGLAGAGSVVLGNGTSGNTNLIVNVLSSSTNSAFSGVISEAAAGQGSLTKTGSGMLTLSGGNTYTGGTTVGNGLLVAGASSLGSGPLNLAAATCPAHSPVGAGPDGHLLWAQSEQ